MRGTSCPSAEQWLNLSGKFITDQKTTDPLRTSETFVAGKCQGIYVKFLHINVNSSGSLFSIQYKKKPMLFAEISNLLCRHHGAAYIRSMKTDQKSCRRAKKRRRFIQKKCSVRCTRNTVKVHTLLLQLD